MTPGTGARLLVGALALLAGCGRSSLLPGTLPGDSVDDAGSDGGDFGEGGCASGSCDVDFAGCALTGTCPDLGGADLARPTDFAGCPSTGTCPDLSRVDLSIPIDIAGCPSTGTCPDLSRVDLSIPIDIAGCQSTGTCPDLSRVDLSIPIDIAGCPSTGTCPDLSRVDLSIPIDIAGCPSTGTCPDLSRVDLSIPIDIAGCPSTGTCPDLSRVDLSEPTDLAGCQSTGTCPDLSRVDLSIPIDIAGCQSTGTCPDLSRVDFSIPIDIAGCPSTGTCPDLSRVDLSIPTDFAGCQLTGTCPDLSRVDLWRPHDLSGCALTGTCPDLVRDDLSIPEDLAGCQLTGTCPDLSRVDLSTPPDLAGCLFSGTCPDLSSTCQSQVEVCTNGLDDNCDGLVDCADPSCAGDPACVVIGAEVCNNGIDDNDNGLVDCADPACMNFPLCQIHTCDPAHVDCADPLCNMMPQCQNLLCMPTVHFGTLQPTNSSSEQTVSTAGTVDVTTTPCAPGGGGMVVSDFTVAKNGTGVKLTYTQGTGADHVFALYRAGINQACNANPVDCYDPKAAPAGNTSFLLDAGQYYLVIQSVTKAHQGSADVTLSTGTSTVAEICNNGVDDDGNGLTDCGDPACFTAAVCLGHECKPDLNVGTLVVNAPGQTVTFDTTGATQMDINSCGGTGNDTVVEFSIKQTAGILLQWNQGSSDHTIGLFRMPPTGQACGSDELDCYVPTNVTFTELVDWGPHPAGSYLFIFKPVDGTTAGAITATISAYQNGTVELCHNGIDDDANGLVDCADPACTADPGCVSQICRPDLDLGTFQLGDSQSISLDLTNGQPNQVASCAMGGGRSRIVQFTLAENAGVTVNCNQTSGNEVLALETEAGPRQGCDQNEITCVNPGTIPFGCNFEWPNMQAGTYYLIFEAFQPGSEGTIDLTLGAVADTLIEICTNGVDDDGDGFTDCADRKCAGTAVCIPRQCTAAKVIKPMPLDGSVVKVSLDTSTGLPLALPQASPSCELVAGGGTQVVAITMPGPGDLTIQFVQAFSNAVFALYTDPYSGSLCDEFPPLQCLATGGTLSGTVTLPMLAAGDYWLVVAADKPGDEGPISLQITGKLSP